MLPAGPKHSEQPQNLSLWGWGLWYLHGATSAWLPYSFLRGAWGISNCKCIPMSAANGGNAFYYYFLIC